jgi:aromatic ring-opening dioxygenase catalytic subunit (LigB family)
MTKCKISIETHRDFDNQSEAGDYLKKLIDAGVLFIHSYSLNSKTRIDVNETTFYQTQAEAKIGLKKFVDAGILYLEVEKDD